MKGMDKALLQRKNLDALLAAIRESGVLYAPVRDWRDGGTVYAPMVSAEDIRLDGTNTRLSAKGLFFPQRETLLRFSGSSLTEETLPKGCFTVFGVRPCDARSLTWLEGVFCGGGQEDPYFRERRRSALVISMACDHPCTSCFCTSVGGSPYGTDGADLLASATGTEGAFLLEAVTEKGRELLRAHEQFFAPADEKALGERASREASARDGMKTLDLTGLKERLDAGIESPRWEGLSATCLGCGVCAYLCPSCHCFDITDETQGAEGIRVRSWDTCQFPRFTLHASGHNPRPEKKARLRQRIMHKFSYAVETAGTVSCSGCGRCVRACPVNLDIRRILAAFKDLS